MKRKNSWKDHYTDRAREEKWLARSVYKLEEIDKKHGIIKRGFRLLDLGCFPGSWSQYCLKKVGRKGEVVGLDIKSPDRINADNFRFIKADILTLETDRLAQEVGKVDAVISDMAPKTSGIRVADTIGSIALAEKAFEIARALLKEKGYFLCKIFEGEELKPLRNNVSEYFNQIKLVRPAAVRKRSREVYLLGLMFIK
jgi:23S rRNA (uridine2552-2'-O)-methyltransferase